MTSWHRNEYILKGLFLGLWTFVALQVAVKPNAVQVDLPWVLGWVGAGLAIGLIRGTLLQLRRCVMPGASWEAFPLLVRLGHARRRLVRPYLRRHQARHLRGLPGR